MLGYLPDDCGASCGNHAADEGEHTCGEAGGRTNAGKPCSRKTPTGERCFQHPTDRSKSDTREHADTDEQAPEREAAGFLATDMLAEEIPDVCEHMSEREAAATCEANDRKPADGADIRREASVALAQAHPDVKGKDGFIALFGECKACKKYGANGIRTDLCTACNRKRANGPSEPEPSSDSTDEPVETKADYVRALMREGMGAIEAAEKATEIFG